MKLGARGLRAARAGCSRVNVTALALQGIGPERIAGPALRERSDLGKQSSVCHGSYGYFDAGVGGL